MNDSVEAVYLRHRTSVLRYLTRLTDAEEAEDIMQEVFERYIKTTREKELSADHVLPWLFRVARNITIDRARKNQREANVPYDDEIAPPAPDRKEALEAIFERDLVAGLFVVAETMDSDGRYRRLLELLLDNRYNQNDMARLLDCSDRTIRRMTTRLLDRLARALDEAGVSRDLLPG